MKTVELNLPYYIKGDDLAYFTQKCNNNSQALENYAMMLDCASEAVYNVFDIISKYEREGRKIDITADTHIILIDCDDDIADELLQIDYVIEPDWLDEDLEVLDDELYFGEDEVNLDDINS